MNPDTIFQAANSFALVAWLALLADPLLPRLSRIVVYATALGLSVVYAGLMMGFFATAQGGFGSLDAVAQLFGTRELLLAGWLHYLAFDLLVGAWIVRTARAEGIPFLPVALCLPLTFLFGPAGYLAFNALRAPRLARNAAL